MPQMRAQLPAINEQENQQLFPHGNLIVPLQDL
jgi:hypothetical protein